MPAAGGGQGREIEDSTAGEDLGRRRAGYEGGVHRFGGLRAEPRGVVDRESQGGDASHAAIVLAAGQEHDVGDARRQVDRGGPAHLHDTGPGSGRILVGATQHQHPAPPERLRGGPGLGLPGHRGRGRDRDRGRDRGRGGRLRGDGGLRRVLLVGRSGAHVRQQREERALVEDGDPLGHRPSGLRRERVRVVGDEDAGVTAHRRHHVQAARDRPGDEFDPGDLRLTRHGDLHPLDERVTGLQRARVPVGARDLRQLRREPRVLPRRAGHQGSCRSSRTASASEARKIPARTRVSSSASCALV